MKKGKAEATNIALPFWNEENRMTIYVFATVDINTDTVHFPNRLEIGT